MATEKDILEQILTELKGLRGDVSIISEDLNAIRNQDEDADGSIEPPKIRPSFVGELKTSRDW